MKNFYKNFILISIMLFLTPYFALAVNDVTLDANTNFELNTADASPVLTTIIGQNGGQVTSLDVQTNYIDITLDNASNITFNTSVSNQYFTVAKQSGSDDYTTSPSCITNQVTMTGTGAAVVLRLQVTSALPGCAGGGGGGGGGGAISPQAPYNTSVIINNNAEETNSRQVILALSATNAAQMMISNDTAFTNAQWEAFQTTKTWTLSEGFGIKTVYVKFRSSLGRESTAVSDTINYVDRITPDQCVLNCDKISYDLYIVNPDSTERHINTNFVQTEHLGNNTYLYKFEDKGSDMDYNDIWIIAEMTNCKEIKFLVQKVDSGWEHQIKVKLLYQNSVKENILLWSNSHQAVDQSKTIALSNYSSLCESQIPVTPCAINCDLLSYDLYIINPDTTERHINTPYVITENLENGTYIYKFEDKGADMDHNDIWIMVEKKDCDNIVFSVIKLDAGWHHTIRTKLIYNGTEKENILLWQDSHLAVGQFKTIQIADYRDICVTETDLRPGDLIKGSRDTVYYYGIDGYRYIFPNRNTYMTWYNDFLTVKTIDDNLLATIPLKDNITYRPGIRMIKIISIPNVYAVDLHGVLRWITTEELAEYLYGAEWATFVDDLPDSFFFSYTIGQPIENLTDFNPIVAASLSPDIQTDKQIMP